MEHGVQGIGIAEGLGVEGRFRRHAQEDSTDGFLNLLSVGGSIRGRAETARIRSGMWPGESCRRSSCRIRAWTSSSITGLTADSAEAGTTNSKSSPRLARVDHQGIVDLRERLEHPVALWQRRRGNSWQVSSSPNDGRRHHRSNVLPPPSRVREPGLLFRWSAGGAWQHRLRRRDARAAAVGPGSNESHADGSSKPANTLDRGDWHVRGVAIAPTTRSLRPSSVPRNVSVGAHRVAVNSERDVLLPFGPGRSCSAGLRGGAAMRSGLRFVRQRRPRSSSSSGSADGPIKRFARS